MTNTQVVNKEAKIESTNSAVSEQAPDKKGDYTKYFYKNIERLWDAVESLQRENDTLESKLKNASAVLNGGE
jgi:hypothetical protein